MKVLIWKKVWLLLLETGNQLKETINILDKKLKDTEEKFRKTDKQIQETDRIVRSLSNKLKESEKRCGNLVEALVEIKLIDMLNEKGLPVIMTSMRINRKYDGEDFENDIIAKNGKEVVVVEVKNTLGIEDVQHFLNKLKIYQDIISDIKQLQLICKKATQ